MPQLMRASLQQRAIAVGVGSCVRRLTREQSRELDRICIEVFGIPGLLLMEHAGIALQDACREMLGDRLRVGIVCGGGNNGGDGYTLARLLANRGSQVRLFATKPFDALQGDAGVNARICERMKLSIEPADPGLVRDASVDLLVDALLGTGLTRPPRPDAVALIDAINANPAPVLAVDVPSGLDCDTGRPIGDACVRADRTVTMVAEKVGFPHAGAYVGRVTVGDIGAPSVAVEQARSSQPSYTPDPHDLP
jgi:NAD(P)H-hydrate epimerase